MSTINDATSVSSSAETLKVKAAAATAAMKAKMEQQAIQKAEKEAAKAAEKAEKEAAKAIEKEAAKAAKAAEKEAAAAEKAAAKAAKEAEKATQPKRPVGRPKKASSTSSTTSESAPVAPAPEHLDIPILKAAPEAAVDPLERIKQLEDEVAEYRTYITAMQASLATLDSIRKMVHA